MFLIGKRESPKEGECLTESKERSFRVSLIASRIIAVPMATFIFFMGIPFYKDTYHFLIKSEEPIVATNTVEDIFSNLGAWFIGQSITIKEDGVEKKIHLFFSGGVWRRRTYEFTYLPRSKEVLEYRLIE